MVRRAGMLTVGLFAVLLVAVAFVYAGSPNALPAGVEIAGVDVADLSPAEAVRSLERREGTLRRVPLTVEVDDRAYRVRPVDVALEIDWRAAVAEAQGKTDGVRPLRGLRRLATRAFGTEVTPTAAIDRKALARVLAPMTRGDVAYRDASIRLVGLRATIVPERDGLALDADEAETAIVGALARLDRTPVKLTATTAEPKVTAEMLAPALEDVRTALSGPVRLVSGNGFMLVSARRMATLLDLPSGGERKLRIGGPAADRYFARLAATINTKPQNADFVVTDGNRVVVKPSVNGRAVDVPRTANRLFAAALRPERRTAQIVVGTKEPARTTAEAKRMGISRLLGTYSTAYSGDADRITNLRLGVLALDGTLVPPGGTFSLNAAIGERTAERGFRPAPVILGTKYVEEVGGGTSQVATTAFNAAWEAGLKITQRAPHALYISRYPLGRDATVYWPSLDLKFLNDTRRWVLVKGVPEAYGIRMSIYGGEARRVVSSAGTMEYTGSPPVKRVKDPTLLKGTTVIEEVGSRPSRTSVTRTIYDEDGALLRSETWATSYRGETRVIRVGTKPKPKPEPSPKTEPPPPADTPGPGT